METYDICVRYLFESRSGSLSGNVRNRNRQDALYRSERDRGLRYHEEMIIEHIS